MPNVSLGAHEVEQFEDDPLKYVHLNCGMLKMQPIEQMMLICTSICSLRYLFILVLEFAFKIESSLLMEVQRLQSLLGECDKAIQNMKEEER
ncbi:hypothetical protein ACEPAG_3630 [Sanghuangporus baumii]